MMCGLDQRPLAISAKPCTERPAMKALAIRFLRDASGATSVEYGLIVGLIAIVTIACLVFAGDTVSKTFTKAADALPSAGK